MTQTNTDQEPATASHQQAQLFALLARHRHEFIAFLRRRTASDTDVEDLLQHALLRAVQKSEQLRRPELALAWFHTILRRVLVDHRAARSHGVAALQGYAAAQSSIAEPVVRCCCSLEMVKAMPSRQAEVLRRIDIEEEEVATVARSLGITRGNLAVRLHRARIDLRQRLAEACGTTSTSTCRSCGTGAKRHDVLHRAGSRLAGGSTGILGDALDMFDDAAVYGYAELSSGAAREEAGA